VNPSRGLTNEQRRRGNYPEEKRKVIRIKDGYRRRLSTTTGRKVRYGGVKGKRRKGKRRKERESYKKRKNKVSRRGRKGRWQKTTRKEERKGSRFGYGERRADVRRWRAGRVKTIYMGRERIEEGKVEYRKERGESQGKRKWQGKVRKEGEGRKREEGTWKKRKEERVEKVKKEEGERKAAKYREVDYVSGTRRVYRKPQTGEIWMPKGRKRSRGTRVG
jgi:hypothetical protein